MYTKFLFFLLLLPITSFSQYETAIQIHNNSKSLYPFDTFYIDSNDGIIDTNEIKYLKKLDSLAQIKADELSKIIPFNKGSYNYLNDSNYNFWFGEFDTDDDGNKIIVENDDYINYASQIWGRLEVDFEVFYTSFEKQIIKKHDIKELFNVLQSTEVGFGISKTDSHVIVVGYYNR